MSPVSKDLAIGAVVLGACLTLVGFAFLEPGSDEEVGEGPERPPAEQAQRPSGSDLGNDDVSGNTDRIDDTIGNLLGPTVNEDAENRERQEPIGIEDVIGGADREPLPGPRGPEGVADAPPVPAPVPHPVASQNDHEGERIGAEEPEPAGPTRRIHVVAAGETYQTISQRYYGTTRKWQRIADANGIGEYDLRVGMKLEIPSAPRTGGDGEERETSGSGLRTHVVASGETYQTISQRYYGTTREWRRIADANDIGEYDLRVGMKLRIPPAPTRDRSARGGGSAAGRVVHVVAAHEFLGDISLKYYGTTRRWKQIADANGIEDPTSLKEGTKLVVPRLSHEADGRTPVVAQTTPVGTSHTVQSGETLETISQRYLGKKSRWREIAAANPGIDPRRLMVGQKILVPRVERPDTLVPTESSQARPAPGNDLRPARGWEETANRPEDRADPLLVPDIPPPPTEESDAPAPLPWEE